MQEQKEKGFHPIYILAGIYTMVIYLFPVAFFVMNINAESENNLNLWPIGLPVFLGLVNLLVVVLFKDKLGRIRLLNCSILIKYTLIPFYIVGGLSIAVALLLMFTPVVIMVFVGPAVATVFSILGWIAMVGAAPYSIGYITLSYKEGIHGKFLSVLAGILQFFFTVDVLSIMVLSLKEKRCVKRTIALMVILVLAVIISMAWIVVKIIGMF